MHFLKNIARQFPFPRSFGRRFAHVHDIQIRYTELPSQSPRQGAGAKSEEPQTMARNGTFGPFPVTGGAFSLRACSLVEGITSHCPSERAGHYCIPTQRNVLHNLDPLFQSHLFLPMHNFPAPHVSSPRRLRRHSARVYRGSAIGLAGWVLACVLFHV